MMNRLKLVAFLLAVGGALGFGATASHAQQPPSPFDSLDIEETDWKKEELPAEAFASEWSVTEQTAVRLLSSTESVGDTQTLRFGLHFKLRPGWKIYWRSPGDAGFPPFPQWDKSENLEKVEIRWPAPERFQVLGLQTLGYKQEVIFPLDVTLKDARAPLGLKTTVPYLVCDDVCIPYRAELALDVPGGAVKPTAHAHQISKFDAKVPGDGGRHGLKIAHKAGLSLTKKDKRTVGALELAVAATPGFKAPDLFLEGPEELSFSKPEIALKEDGSSAVLKVKIIGADDLEGGAEKGLEKATFTATLVDGERSAERQLTLVDGQGFDAEAALQAAAADGGPGSGSGGGSGSGTGGTDVAGAGGSTGGDTGGSLAFIILLAVVGGLILNLMPCVLPVLSIKMLGVVGHGGGDTGHVRASFLASAAGILAAFLALASALVALQQAGMSIGWGIQFQQSWFLAVMAVIVTLFACNLWGLFEINLPASLNDLGGKLSGGNGISGHFLQGALATLLATPCSAPFLGTAVGFALARGAFEIYAIFTGLAVGLALPYLAVALYPRLATNLPKPGAWMVRLRQVMGLALAATAAWLVSVLATSAGTEAATVIGAALLAISGVLFIGKGQVGLFKRIAPVVTVVLAFGAIVSAEAFESGGSTAERSKTVAAAGGAHWQAFDEASITGLISEGNTILVDVTADWCITCQVNKKLVLDTDPIIEVLSADGMVAMVADWTRPDPAISQYLARFNRFGIPFNVVYGPAAPDGIPLPELLTETAVMTALKQASGKTQISQR